MKYLSLILFVFLFSCHKSSDNQTPTVVPQVAQQQDCEPISFSANIIGGTRVNEGDADAKATTMIISLDKSTGQAFICTATPITDHTLVTAAHCVNTAGKIVAVFYTDISCDSGFRFSHNTVTATAFTFNPGYNPGSMTSANPDIGLVHLAVGIQEGYHPYKINLHPETLQSNLYLYGYGLTGSNNNDSTYLRKTFLTPNQYQFDQQSIVIPNNGSNGICLGDSGGPGLVNDNGELEIATVNSFGYGPRNDVCGGQSTLVLLYPYISWIKSTLDSWGDELPQ